VTQEEGILEEVYQFDKILDDAKIENIIAGAKICSNAKEECTPFHEGIDQMVTNGLLNNPSLANELDVLIHELNTCA
jgi:hypothetical protein